MSDTTTTAATPDDDLARGTRHHGFVVTDVQPIPERQIVAYVMRHERTGARLLWLSNDDQNKTFSISFKTPPADDTGVFHILEHSVLCGSDRFPVKEPFVNLLKTSMQTFLNAMTFPDKTMYPVSSTNDRDLANLMDVYLDAVLHPAIYARRRIFEQEGWHYEIEGEGADERLVRNGVVLNEMKGALSNPSEVLAQALNRQLFPDTPYRWESGGDPAGIPGLTYEEFLDAHARHYRLDNSYTILYGNLDIEAVLAFVSERFDGAEDRGAVEPNPLPLQRPVASAASLVTMATAPENAACALGAVIGTASDAERLLGANLLLDAIMGSNEAPLKRAILDSGLGRDASGYLMSDIAQPYVMLQLKSCKPDSAQAFEDLVRSECLRMSREGIPRELIDASLSTFEFACREGNQGTASDGIELAMASLSTWLYDDADPIGDLRYESLTNRMRAHLDRGDGWFEDLLREVFCECEHHACVELVPTDDPADAAERSELASILSGMSDGERRAVREEVDALRAEQEAPDAPEDLAKLPTLSVSDIGPMPDEPECHDLEASSFPFTVLDAASRGINYVWTYFDLGALSYDEIPYASILCRLLGSLDTDAHTATELDTIIEANLGNLSFFCKEFTAVGNRDDVRACLAVNASFLAEKADQGAAIPQEIWSSTHLRDRDRVRDLLQQQRISLERGFMGAGNSYARNRATSYFARGRMLREQICGIDYYLLLRDILDDFDARFDDLCDKLDDIRRRVFRAGNARVFFAGTDDEAVRYDTSMRDLSLFPALPDDATDLLRIPEPRVLNEAFAVPGTVAYVAEAIDMGAGDANWRKDGSWLVATRGASLDYLWNEVRVKGGAYGCSLDVLTTGLARFSSYRDPGVDATVSRYEGAADWLATWQPSDDELAGYIISIVGGSDVPKKPKMLATVRLAQLLTGSTRADRRRMREEVLATTVEDLHERAASLRGDACERGFCAFGNKGLLEGSELGMTVIDLMALGTRPTHVGPALEEHVLQGTLGNVVRALGVAPVRDAVLLVHRVDHDPLGGLAHGQHELDRHPLGKVEGLGELGTEALDHAAAQADARGSEHHRLGGDARVDRADRRDGLGDADHDVSGRALGGLGTHPVPQPRRPRQGREGGVELIGLAHHTEAQLLHVVSVGGKAREVHQLRQGVAADGIGGIEPADAAGATDERLEVDEAGRLPRGRTDGRVEVDGPLCEITLGHVANLPRGSCAFPTP